MFVDADTAQIQGLYSEGIIDIAQLHGSEGEEDILALKAAGVPVIKAVRVQSPLDVEQWRGSAADWLLLDNGAGGTGQSFNWMHAHHCPRPYFLAGGIGVHNIREALRLKPYCIDLSSGAETDGKKDRQKLLELTEIVRREQ